MDPIRSFSLGPPFDFFATNDLGQLALENSARADASSMEVTCSSQLTNESFVLAAATKLFTIEPRERSFRLTYTGGINGYAGWIGLGHCSAQFEIVVHVGSTITSTSARDGAVLRRRVGRWDGGFYPGLHFFQWPFDTGTPRDPIMHLDLSPTPDVRTRQFALMFQIEARTTAAGWAWAQIRAGGTPTFLVETWAS